MNDSYCVGLAALDNFDMAVARFDLGGVLTYQNHAAARLFGVPRGTHVDIAMLVTDPVERERVHRQMLERGRGKSSVYETSFRPPYGPPGDPAIPVSVFAFPDTDTEGGVLGSIVLVRDLREEQTRDRIHEAIETSCDNPAMFAQLASHLRALIDFDELRIISISRSREHFRLLYTTNDQANAEFPFRWWPLQPFLQETRDEWTALVMEVDGMLADPRYQDLLARDETTRNFLQSGVRQVLSLPVYDQDGIAAFFSLDSRVAGRYNAASIRLLERLPIAQAVLAALHREQLDQQRHFLELIRDIGAMSDNVQGAAQELVQRLVKDFGWAHVAIFQRDSSRRQFRLVYQASLLPTPELPADLQLTGDNGISAIVEAADTRRRVNVRDTRARGPLAGLPGFVAEGSELAIPIQGRKVQWILNIESVRKNAFSAEEEDLLQMLANEAGSVLHRSALFELQQAVLSSINDAVIETNSEGYIRWSNRAAHELLSGDPENGPQGRIADLFAGTSADRRLLDNPRFSHHHVDMHGADGEAIPVLLSGSRLPAHLSGHVYVISDFRYQKEVSRLNELKDVFRQAAMEGRVPLALAMIWLRQLAENTPALAAEVDRITAQLGRADLPLERLLRLFSAEGGTLEVPRADLNLALQATLAELPQSLAQQVERQAGEAPLPVGVSFDNLHFCVESMISFGLRTRPQSKKLSVRAGREGAEALFSVQGDWLPDMKSDERTGPAEQSRRKSLSDLALGESIIERIIANGHGRYECEFEPFFCMRFALPVLND